MNVKSLEQNLIEQALKAPSSRPPRHRQGERFLKGPIPLYWLRRAASLGGKTLAVAVVICFKAGLTKKRTVRLTGKLLTEFSVGRKAGSRGLKKMESAGLVSVERHAGRCPMVTILEIKPKEKRADIY